MRPAPITAPAAAKSFTSPAPVAPMTCPGSMIASPSARPAHDDSTVTPLAPQTAKRTPLTASVPVRTFGTRLVRRWIKARARAPATSVPSTTRSEGCNNGLPQHVVDRVAHGRDADDRHERDQASEQRVLDQILPFVVTDEPSNRTDD